jgi:hypothetical protein
VAMPQNGRMWQGVAAGVSRHLTRAYRLNVVQSQDGPVVPRCLVLAMRADGKRLG